MKSNKALQNMQAGTRSDKQGDVFQYSYWDRYTLNDAISEITLFQTAQGQGTVPRNFAETNMLQAGCIPNGKQFVWHELKCYYVGQSVKATADLLPIYNLLVNTTVSLDIDGKQDLGMWTLNEIFDNPMSIICSPATGYVNFNQISTISKLNGHLLLSLPITLASLQRFGLRIKHYTPVVTALKGDYIVFTMSGIQTSLS